MKQNDQEEKNAIWFIIEWDVESLHDTQISAADIKSSCSTDRSRLFAIWRNKLVIIFISAQLLAHDLSRHLIW